MAGLSGITAYRREYVERSIKQLRWAIDNAAEARAGIFPGDPPYGPLTLADAAMRQAMVYLTLVRVDLPLPGERGSSDG